MENVEKQWLSVAELAHLTNTPQSSLRRYLELFDDYFRYEARPRGRRYHVGSIDVIARIKHLYAHGLDTDEIREILAREYAVSVDTDDVEPYEPTAPPLPYATRDDLAMAVDALRAELQALRAENERLRHEITDRLEQRDQALMAALRTLQESRQQAKRRWWPFRGD